MIQKEAHEANRASWNVATVQHNQHKGDQAAFFRNGGTTLFPEEAGLLGDIKGQSLLHIQCNSGQDTLSIAAHLGATVTGVDISDEAIDFAQKLSKDSGIPATFIRSDIYDWFEQNEQQYDVVFASYGTINWLSDIKAWGKGIAHALKSGGRFVFIDFHPAATMLETDWNQEDGDWVLTYDYMSGKPSKNQDGVGDYVGFSGDGLTHNGEVVQMDSQFKNPNPAYEFGWGVSDPIMALLEAGLTLVDFREYPYCNGWKPFPNMKQTEGRRMVSPESKPSLAYMFSIVVKKS